MPARRSSRRKPAAAAAAPDEAEEQRSAAASLAAELDDLSALDVTAEGHTEQLQDNGGSDNDDGGEGADDSPAALSVDDSSASPAQEETEGPSDDDDDDDLAQATSPTLVAVSAAAPDGETQATQAIMPQSDTRGTRGGKAEEGTAPTAAVAAAAAEASPGGGQGDPSKKAKLAEDDVDLAADLAPAAAGPKPRLMITDMVLENFKSYAGAQSVGPFHSRFSSIVGPNGSGKSNVIDALLFVFGKRAKELRHSKLSGLIHRSAKFPDLDYCRVEVRFQEIIDHEEGEGFDVLPDSQFSIARKAFLDDKKQPKYELNGKTVKFDVVEKLLEGKGIGLHHNRFLILQGDVEQISLMKPKGTGGSDEGLLEYVEEVIGTDKYVEPIEEKSRELEEISEQRQHRVARLRHVDRELRANEEPMKLGEDFLAQEGKLIDARAQLVQFQEVVARSKLEVATKREAEIQVKLEEQQQQGRADKDRLREYEDEVDAAQKLYDEADSELTSKKKAFQEQDREFTKLKQEKKHAVKAIKTLKEKASREQQKAADFQKAAAQQQAAQEKVEKDQIPKLEQEHERAEKELEQVYASLLSQTQELQATLKAKQAELAPLAKSADDAVAAAAITRSEFELATEEHNSNLKQLKEAELALEQCTTELPAKRKREEKCRARVEELRASVDQCRATISECNKRLPTLQKTARATSQDEQSTKGIMEDAQRALRENGGANSKHSVASQLLQAQKKGYLHGVLGRLGDLASVPADLDCAVSTAAAGALNSIVVETEEDAKAVVKFARENKKLGIITCLIVEKQERLRTHVQTQPFSCPPKSDRLFDKVECEPRLAGCVYYALRDTLVCRSMDDAKRAAFGSSGVRRRVVTIDGKLIETSGTMSGGGRPIKGLIRLARDGGKGAAQNDDIEAEFVRAKQAYEAAKNAAEDAKEALDSCSKQLAEAQSSLPNLEDEISKFASEASTLEMDRSTAGQLEEEIKARLPMLRERCEQSPEDIRETKELQRQLNAHENAAAEAQSKADVLKKQCDKLTTKISEAGGDRVKKQKVIVERVKQALASAAKEKSRLVAAAKSAEKSRQRAEANFDSARKDLEAAKLKRKDIKEQLEKLEESAADVLREQETLEAACKQTSHTLKKLQSRYHKLKATVDEFDQLQINLQLELEDSAKDRTAAEAEVIRHTHALKVYEAQKLECSLDADKEDGESAHSEEILTSESPDSTDQKQGTAIESIGSVERAESEKKKLALIEDAELKEMMQSVDKSMKSLQVAVAKNVEQLGRLGDKADAIRAIKEWRRIKVDWDAKRDELDEITQRKNAVGQAFDALRKQRLDEFMAGFGEIKRELKKMYQMITLGGDADLELVDSMDPFAEGIVFSVRPPKKSWKNIANLSGGEKTLSSLALVFALHYYKPTPLYVMDEIDAALDFKNVSIVANYIKERTRNAQFVIISLRNYMFELADRLVGVYKLTNCSRSVAITPAEFAVPAAKQEEPLGDKENSGPLQSQ